MHVIRSLSPLFIVVMAGLVLAGCPDFSHECDACGHIWCEDNLVVECVCYSDIHGPTDSLIEPLSNCSAAGLTCTELVHSSGVYVNDPGYVTGDARCLDLCTIRGKAQCRGQGPGASWYVCSPAYYGDSYGTSIGDLREDIVAWLETDGQPNAPSYDGFLAWRDSELPCVPCVSTCGCGDSMVCTGGYCVPGQVPEGLACCGREHGTPCPNGQACSQTDGSAGVCETAAHCDPCGVDLVCEHDGLVCDSTGTGLPPACHTWASFNQLNLECREGLNEVWKKDDCDAWTGLAEACEDDHHCENAACIPDLSEIELSPTLLNFGSVAVSNSKELVLSIGNTGQVALTVNEIEVEEPTPGLFQLSVDSLQIEPGKIAEVTVTFTPKETSEVSAKLFIHSDDQDESKLTVLMNGSGE
jgi:hypothetical protein